MSYNPDMNTWLCFPAQLKSSRLKPAALAAAAVCLAGATQSDDRIHPDTYNHWVAATPKVLSQAKLDEAVRLHPKSANAYLERGNGHLTDAEVDNALSDFNKAIALDPRCARAYIGLYFVYSDGQHTNQALAALKKAAEIGPADLSVDALNLQANLHKDMKNFSLAREEFTRVINSNMLSKVRLALAYKLRGVCNDRLGKIKEAISDYSNAVKFDPTDGQAYLFRANDCLNLGDLKNAKAGYDYVASQIEHVSVEKRAPNMETVRNDLYLFRSEYYRRIKRPDLAKADLAAIKRQQMEDIEMSPFRDK